MAAKGQMMACDYVGIVSGDHTPDKMQKSGFENFLRKRNFDRRIT